MIEQKLQSNVQPAGGFDDVDRASQDGVAREDASGPVREADVLGIERRDRPRRVSREAGRRAEPESRHHAEGPVVLECPQQLTKRDFSFAAHDEVDAKRGRGPRVRSQTRVVAADRDTHRWPEGSNQRDDPARRAALKRHCRDADQVGLDFAHQALDRFAGQSLARR